MADDKEKTVPKNAFDRMFDSAIDAGKGKPPPKELYTADGKPQPLGFLPMMLKELFGASPPPAAGDTMRAPTPGENAAERGMWENLQILLGLKPNPDKAK